MKFFTAAITSFVPVGLAATLPRAFTLVAEGGHSLLTDETNILISYNVTDVRTYPILILHSNGNTATYTREGSPPTSWQNLYVIEDAVEPIAMTIPHSAALPEHANTIGFGMTDDGWFTFGGKQLFAVEPEPKQRKVVYYLGYADGEKQLQSKSLWVKECRGC